MPATIASLLYELLGERTELHGGCDDWKKAYRQIPTSDPSRSVVALWDPDNEQVVYFVVWSHCFGQLSSVNSFNANKCCVNVSGLHVEDALRSCWWQLFRVNLRILRQRRDDLISLCQDVLSRGVLHPGQAASLRGKLYPCVASYILLLPLRMARLGGLRSSPLFNARSGRARAQR